MVLAGQAFVCRFAKTTAHAVYEDSGAIVVAGFTLAYIVLGHIVHDRMLHVGYPGVGVRHVQRKYIIDRLLLKQKEYQSINQ